jgi:UDP-2,3-diacylglucosamine pyrophosphatase LpxH
MRNGWDFLSTSGIGPSRQLTPQRTRRHRTIFISDTHLGTRGCKAELLADFLTHNDCRTLYLVGDIIDGWRLKQSWFWSASQTAVLNLILKKAQEGTRVIYVPGNHDEVFRDYCGLILAGVELKRETVHETADGRSLLVTHGDQLDAIIRCARWLALIGDYAYDFALMLNDGLNAVRRRFGLPYWSLSAYLKRKMKKATAFISSFEQVLVREASMRGLDGVIAGHIHHAQTKLMAGVLYCNTGDWVESCTALIEDAHGRLEIMRWTRFADEQASLLWEPAGDAEPGYIAA